ncbi:FliI/YscN family ATPase [Meridianimarinicoccus sp. MJW13]|uniref:FliI/YscN family ATPase n=1 Tax=Meridianimarinicoccus sp. MJW13 TaxID=2720031 RepID=UPI001D034C4E|nr:FliI/YscN family ATPase [Fluviibacterium sp. MJW13]
MTVTMLDALNDSIDRLMTTHDVGVVCEVSPARLRVSGLRRVAAQGDVVEVAGGGGLRLLGDVEAMADGLLDVVPRGLTKGIAEGDRVLHLGRDVFAPDDSWIGRVLDPFGHALDQKPVRQGTRERTIRAAPPVATSRRGFGPRLETGHAVFNTFLPLARGQRIGLFAGSGVGKSTLLADLARRVEADLVVVALIGERGREVNHFVDHALGDEGLQRAVVFAATADQPASARQRCAHAAMTTAEFFRDQGRHVLLLIDSVTRLAEAHRDIALSRGAAPGLDGFPPSVVQEITQLAERAGPGAGDAGDITAIMSVLVAGSNMDGLIADTLRGVLDGHVVLDRGIAERGRFPAVNVLRSVSRSLPECATIAENALMAEARQALSQYNDSELMIRSGLYESGHDREIDRAIRLWPSLDEFVGRGCGQATVDDFRDLEKILSSA